MGNGDNHNKEKPDASDKAKAKEEQNKRADKKNQSNYNVAAAKGKSKLSSVIDRLTREDKAQQKKLDKAWADMKKDAKNQAEALGKGPADHLLGKIPHPENNIKKHKPVETELKTKGRGDGYGDPDKIDAASLQRKTEKSIKKTTRDRVSLSPGERAERAKVAESKGDTIGFGFNKHTVSKSTLERWWKSQTQEVRDLVQSGKAAINLVGRASRPGTTKYNHELSEKRIKTVEKFLISKGADPAQILRLPSGESSILNTKPEDENKDNHKDRVVKVMIFEGITSKPKDTSPKDPKKDAPENADARKEAQEATKGLKKPTKPEKYTPEQGIRDLPKEVFLEIVLPSLVSAVKTFIDYTLKLAEAIGECHDNNVKAAEIKGFANGISILHGASTNLDNPHIKTGKPYTKEEFYKAAKVLWKSDGIAANAIGRVEATKDADKAYRRITDRLADTANKILRMGKSPEQRQAAMKKFVQLATKKFQDIVSEQKRKNN